MSDLLGGGQLPAKQLLRQNLGMFNDETPNATLHRSLKGGEKERKQKKDASLPEHKHSFDFIHPFFMKTT